MTDVQPRTKSAMLLSGVDTLARLLVLRHQLDERDGLRTATMVSGYPGSPLGTFDLSVEGMGKLREEHGVVHRPGLNEELAVATVWGSQMGAAVEYAGVDGVAGVWYGKTPGLDRSGDAMKHANAMGAGPNGGAVMFCGDDPSAKSSTLPCDSQLTFEDACMPVLVPGDQQDILDLGAHAFRMSRYAGTWVGLKVVTSVADGIGSIDVDPDRHHPAYPTDLEIDGVPWRHEPLSRIGPHAVPGQESLVVHQRLVAAKAYARHNGIDRVIGAEPGARLGIVCAGKTSFDVRQSLRDLGVDDLAAAGIRILKLGMTWPVVEETVVAFADSVQQLLVIEEKRPFVETQLRTILHEAGNSVPVLGKKQTGAPLVGELDSATIARIIGGVLPDLAPPPIAVATGRTHLPVVSLPARSPGFCSGCPHNRSTVFPEDALVGGGVGCHGIVYFEARHQGMKALPPTPMGAEGVPWIGLSPFVDEPHLIQNLGDGTLSHSGTLAIRASVAAGVNVTFKILYNAAVAMTGGQDVVGLMDVPAMTRALEAEGVRRIVVCSAEPDRYGRRARWAEGVEVLDRDQLDDAQRRLRQVEGVSVIIYDQQCAAEARRLRKKGLLATPPRRVVINEAVCEGCGDCSVKSNCLSVLPVDTEFGVKRQIHDPSCNRDYTCLEGDCPSFVTLKPARFFGRRPKQGDARPRLPSGELPTPTPAVIDGRFGVYFTGIGGTGVVTAARIIAEAADRAGLQVGGMDQTGLSQKAGAVVSHLHLAHDHESLGSPNVSSGGADLYLSGDILQAAGPMHLDKVKEGRAVGVVAHDLTPTTAMLQAGIEAPQAGDLEARIRERLASVAFVDSQRIAEHALGNHLLANVVLLGAAFQLGGLPLTLADLDGAIERQGKAAAANRAAFEWGRWAAHDPAAVAAVLGGSGERSIWDPADAAMVAARPLVERRDLPHELHDLLVRRTAQAIEYQGRKRAERFLGLVAEVARRDTAEQGWLLTRTVADVWFKLLTYKDEYDVARLHLKLDMDEVAREYGIDGRYKVTYHLHPPLLRRMGLEKKLPMGKPYEVAFHALRRMKGLRGTPLDVFGYDPDRRMERALIDEYERLVQEMAGEPYDQQVRIADSGHTIKGYGPIKERNVERWRAELAALRQA